MLSERQISHVYVSAYLAGQLHDYNHIRYLLYLDLCTIIASSWSILFLILYFLFSWREESSRDICMYLYRQIWVTRLPLAERKFQFVWLFILLFFFLFFFFWCILFNQESGGYWGLTFGPGYTCCNVDCRI